VIKAIANRSRVVKIEIAGSPETHKKLLNNTSTPQEKERIQTIHWLKTKTVETIKQITIVLGRNCVTVQIG
jgi:hypothetical protein